MDTLTFYEKPGCAGNRLQRRWLEQRGYTLQVRNLLAEPWTAARLQSFFGQRPVRDWFNTRSPRIVSGSIRPGHLDAEAAMTLMLADPLLIRRPLIEWPGGRLVGFQADLWAAIFGGDPDIELGDCLGSDVPCSVL